MQDPQRNEGCSKLLLGTNGGAAAKLRCLLAFQQDTLESRHETVSTDMLMHNSYILFVEYVRCERA